MAEVRLDPGRAERFSSSTQSVSGFAPLPRARSAARFTIAQDEGTILAAQPPGILGCRINVCTAPVHFAREGQSSMRIIVAITGATGAAYGIRLLAALAELGVESHLVLSRWAEVTVLKETGLTAREVGAMASVLHSRDNQGA